jgi:hypothetical protein
MVDDGNGVRRNPGGQIKTCLASAIIICLYYSNELHA